MPEADLPPSTTDASWSKILDTASREELLAAARQGLTSGRPLEEVILLLDYVTKSRPEFAIDLARDIGRSDAERHVLLVAVLDDWARADPPQALRWAAEQSVHYDSAGEASLLYVVLEQVATDEPSTALAAAERILRAPPEASPETPGAEQVAHLTIEALVKTGHLDLAQDAVRRWASGPEAAGMDSTAYEIVALSLGQRAMTEAADWLASLPSSAGRSQASESLARAWSETDAPAAMNWAQGLNQANERTAASAVVFGRWLQQDRRAATQWLEAQESSPEGDRFIARLLIEPNIVLHDAEKAHLLERLQSDSRN